MVVIVHSGGDGGRDGIGNDGGCVMLLMLETVVQVVTIVVCWW